MSEGRSCDAVQAEIASIQSEIASGTFDRAPLLAGLQQELESIKGNAAQIEAQIEAIQQEIASGTFDRAAELPGLKKLPNKPKLWYPRR